MEFSLGLFKWNIEAVFPYSFSNRTCPLSQLVLKESASQLWGHSLVNYFDRLKFETFIELKKKRRRDIILIYNSHVKLGFTNRREKAEEITLTKRNWATRVAPTIPPRMTTGPISKLLFLFSSYMFQLFSFSFIKLFFFTNKITNDQCTQSFDNFQQ